MCVCVCVCVCVCLCVCVCVCVCVCARSESVKAHLSSAQTGVVTGSAKWPSMCRESHFLNGCLSLYVHLIEIFPGLQRPANKIALLRHSLFPPHAQLIPIFFSHLFWKKSLANEFEAFFCFSKLFWRK